MPVDRRTITIEVLAPVKPAWGAPCNGCGVCCLVEPCPVGMLLSRKRRGACDAVHWDAAQFKYRCGAIVGPQKVLLAILPVLLRGLVPVLAPLLAVAARRSVAVGSGCDCTLAVELAPSGSDPVPASDAA